MLWIDQIAPDSKKTPPRYRYSRDDPSVTTVYPTSSDQHSSRRDGARAIHTSPSLSFVIYNNTAGCLFIIYNICRKLNHGVVANTVILSVRRFNEGMRRLDRVIPYRQGAPTTSNQPVTSLPSRSRCLTIGTSHLPRWFGSTLGRVLVRFLH
jgi:hypothetical protein